MLLEAGRSWAEERIVDLDLGIGGYSTRSKESSIRFAEKKNANTVTER